MRLKHFAIAGMTAILALACAWQAGAGLVLPNVLGSHMVVQRGEPIFVWGQADPGSEVTVEMDGAEAATQADASGVWRVNLPALDAGGPYTLTIRNAGEVRVLEDVLVGDVWLCSGQSNMVWPISRSANPEAEAAAADYPGLRLFKAAQVTSETPLEDIEGAWAPCTPESAADFSAVAYYFGRHLHNELGIPIGVVQTAWGGTPAEAWTSNETLEQTPGLQPILERWEQRLAEYPEAMGRYEEARAEWEAAAQAARDAGEDPPAQPRPPMGPDSPHRPANLFNGMISPFLPYAVRGVIWYQGESNADRAYQYRTLFPAMINDWRMQFNRGDLPFFFVQLANFMARGEAPEDSAWAELREAQTMALELPNTGMATAIDIGEADDIHPKNKEDVGLRLAYNALAKVYGRGVPYSGPMFSSMEVSGGRAVLKFDHTHGGLTTPDGSGPKGFAIAGTDRKFVWAEAEILSEDEVAVWSSEVSSPAAVRYAWANNPEATLYNGAGLPAVPFRTDEWPGVTADRE